MKKKIALGATAVMMLAVGVAMAVTNTYSVTASTLPLKAGTPAKPTNVTLSFDYSVGEVDGNRASSVKEYQIRFTGIQLAQKGLKSCTADEINGAGTAESCPAAAVVGTGSVDNRLGPTSDPTNKALHCFLELTIYNSKVAKHATLYLKGRKANAAPKDCITDIDTAIDAKYTIGTGASKFSTLSFKVPPALLHPLPGLDNSVENVQSKIANKKTTAKKNGRVLSYYHSVGGCKSNKRAVQVTFISEDDKKSVAKTNAKCTK